MFYRSKFNNLKYLTEKKPFSRSFSNVPRNFPDILQFATFMVFEMIFFMNKILFYLIKT